MPAAAKHRNARFAADVDGEPLDVIIEKDLAKQCSDAMPRSIAVLREVSGCTYKRLNRSPGIPLTP